MQAVGELDQEHARVVGDREQELAEILGLLRVLGDEVELAELGQAVDQAADLLAERLVDVLAGDGGVLDRVVQHGRDDGRVVDLELGQDRRDFERMREIGIARGALLAAMRLHGEHIGAVEQILVGASDCSGGPAPPVRIAASSPQRLTHPASAESSWPQPAGGP